MQFKSAALATLALAYLAAATPTKRCEEHQCNTGEMQCCQSVQPASSSTAAGLIGLLGAVVGDVNTMVGITCSPITGVGISGNSCTAQPVCCTNNTFNGIIAIGCMAINVNL